MDASRLTRVNDVEWRLSPSGPMRVPAVIYADEALLRAMDDKVLEQAANVAALPGIVKASFAPEAGGVVCAGGVGFDISCGVRTMLTGLRRAEVEPVRERLADALFRAVPAGLGRRGEIRLSDAELDAMLAGGAAWAVERGYGEPADLERIEECGRAADARPEFVSGRAKERQRSEMGTLGSGNHYLEVQEVDRLVDAEAAAAFGLREGEVVVTIHCGSRGLGHQVGTDFLREMVLAAEAAAIALPERELACTPIDSEVGHRYLGAMRAGINCALANRQIIGHLTRRVFAELFPRAELRLLYDVSHNTCKVEAHAADGERRPLYVHRKGATRALGPGHPDLPADLRPYGQPVLIGGSMGTESWVLAGTAESEARAFGSAVHGAGRSLSRHQAVKRWRGEEVVRDLAARGVLVRGHSWRDVAEEAPAAYKDVGAVVDAAHRAGLARKVARLKPLVCIKG